MDDPNITMEEYISLKEEKARRHGRTFNWQTITFRKVENYEDEDDCFIDFETEFPAIVFDNTLTALPSEPTILNPQHIDEFNLNNETSLSEYDKEEQNVLHFNDLFLLNIIHPDDLKSEKDNDDNDIDINSFTIIDGDDMTKDVVLGMKFCKKYASCQMIMKKFALGDKCERIMDGE
ncbi:hypothetical protein Tco_0162216 [Tanacetum coccineum]